MVILLYIIGVISFLVSLVAGINSRNFLGIVAGIIGGISSAVIFFSLARIIENQETLLSEIEGLYSFIRNFQATEKKLCAKCSREYDVSFGSCPYCGYRQ